MDEGLLDGSVEVRQMKIPTEPLMVQLKESLLGHLKEKHCWVRYSIELLDLAKVLVIQ